MISLQDLLQFENSDDIFKFRFSYDRMLMWPFIRYDLFQKTLQNYLNYQEPHANIKVPIKTKIFHTLFSIYRSPFIERRPKTNILFFSLYLPNNTFIINGKYINRLVDYHYDLCKPETAAVFESYPSSVVKRPRSPAKIYAKDYINLMALLKSSMRKPDESDKMQHENFLSYIMDSYEFRMSDSVKAKLKQRLELISGRLPYYHRYYKKLFKLHKPRLIFLHCACYGLESFITKWAHDHHIKVAELQHGAVYRDHPAYNYGSALSKNDEFRTYLPDYFLTYGSMWNDCVSLPSKLFTLGNPHFLYQKSHINKNISDPTILIASQGSVSNDLVNIAAELSKIMPDNFKIIYKLHPGEVDFKERFLLLKDRKNIQISTNDDIYHLINKSKFIVSCYSTALFEAAALQKNVYIYDHPLSRMYIPEGLGEWFRTAQELYDLLIASNDNRKLISNDKIIDPAFEQNFANFLDSVFRI